MLRCNMLRRNFRIVKLAFAKFQYVVGTDA